jgi:predicted O-methyltransferase YrrM
VISRLQALNLALRHRDDLTRMVRFRHDPSIAWHGSLSEAEHALLKRAVEATAALSGPIIEVGTLFGFTTAMMASWMNGSRKLITVDNFSWNPWGLAPDVHQALARRVLAPFLRTGRVEMRHMGSVDFFQAYNGPPPSLVFIDGDHSYPAVRQDIAWARRLGSADIGGHDYAPSIPGVVQAVEEHFPDATVRCETAWMWGLERDKAG